VTNHYTSLDSLPSYSMSSNCYYSLFWSFKFCTLNGALCATDFGKMIIRIRLEGFLEWLGCNGVDESNSDWFAPVQLNDVDGVEGKHNVFVVVIKRVAHHNSQTAMTRSLWPTVFRKTVVYETDGCLHCTFKLNKTN